MTTFWNRFSPMLFLLVFYPFHTFGQFDPSNFNKKLLEHEIKTLIDSTRLSHQLPALYNDSILYVASVHHANYLVKKGSLSHEEVENKAFFSPQNRANYYGAPKSYLVGENIVYTPYNSSVRVKDRLFQTSSYREIARCLVYSWVNSKGHYKNIVHAEYQVTGLSVAVDPKTQRIYACQKFAQVLYTYSFPENHDFFPYSSLDPASGIPIEKVEPISYPYGLRADETGQCETCRKTWENYPSMSIRVQNKNFILRVENEDFVKELIQNKHDGFAIEIVPFAPFACGNPAYEKEPSRRNFQKRTSGQILEPVYRNELIKGFKKRHKVKNLSFVKYLFTADSVSFFKRFGRYKLVNFEAKYFEFKLGRIPKDQTGWWNHNLVYIHNKQICHFVFLTNYPGELVTDLLEVDYFPPIPVNRYDFNLEYFADTLELFYQSGQTVTSSSELPKLIQRFEQQSLTIQKIQIEGFCSVDGDSLTNERLHQERAKTILDQLKKLTDSHSDYSIRSQVDWKHFYESVKTNPRWKFLYPLSKSEITNYLSNPKNEKPLDILSQERKVKVVIHAVKELSPKTASYYVNRDWRNSFYKDSKGDLYCLDLEKLEFLYEKAYYLLTVDTLSKIDFLKIELPKIKGIIPHSLDHDLAFYRYHLERETTDKTTLRQLEAKVESAFENCGAANHLSPEFHYLSACLLAQKIRQDGSKSTPNNPNIQKAFNRLNGLLQSYDLDSNFYLNVSKANLNIINVLCSNIGPEQIYEYSDIVNSSLIQIVEYYRKTKQLNPNNVLKLSKLLCYFRNIPLAVELCQGFLDNDEVLKLYLPLAYIHSSYLTSEAEIVFERAFHQLLLEAKTRLRPEEWCKLFYGKFGIPFQVMDNQVLHATFCETCPNRVNEVLEE